MHIHSFVILRIGLCCGAEMDSARSEWDWTRWGMRVSQKCLTYNPGASSWAPSPRAWWLCKRHEPPRIRWAGTAPRRCDPSESVPTFSPGSVDNHLKNQLQGEGQSKCIWYSPTEKETESKVALRKLTMSISPFGSQPERLKRRIQKHKNISLKFISIKFDRCWRLCMGWFQHHG